MRRKKFINRVPEIFIACLLFIHDLFSGSEKIDLKKTKKLYFLGKHLAGTSLARCCEHIKQERR